MKPRIYLAGPTVFEPRFGEIFARRKSLCAELGFEGVAPIDGETAGEAPSTVADPRALATRIRVANILKIRACHAIIADISPFRGPGADDGTAWEMGYGEALNKIVLAFSEQADLSYAEQTRRSVGARPAPHPDGALVDDNGCTIEDFSLPANLMLAAGPEPVLPSFEAALKRLSVRIRASE